MWGMFPPITARSNAAAPFANKRILCSVFVEHPGSFSNRVKYEITHISPLFLITTCRSFCMRDYRLCSVKHILRVYYSIITSESYNITASTTHTMRLPAKSSRKWRQRQEKWGWTGFWGETRHGKHPDDFTVDRAEPSDTLRHPGYGLLMMSTRLIVSCCFSVSVSPHKRSRRAALDVNIGQLTPWRQAHKQKYGPQSTWVLHYIILWHIHKHNKVWSW